ncbi:unnamed protein product [Lota lota]
MGTVLRILLLLCGVLLVHSIPGERVRRPSLRVRINVTGDTVVMSFVRPDPSVRLEGYILGYGRSPSSRQFLPLPEDGQPYEMELEAEPKYLVAVQPIPSNDVKKHCTGMVSLEKPLPLVVGSLSPTAVMLSWGRVLKTPYREGDIMEHCLEEGFYTVRYRERNRKWVYQTCPTADTVIAPLKPGTAYEFGVRSTKDQRHSVWSKPVLHITSLADKNQRKAIKMRNPLASPLKPMGPRAMFPPRPALHNRTHPRLSSLIKHQPFPGAPWTSFGDYLLLLSPPSCLLPSPPPVSCSCLLPPALPSCHLPSPPLLPPPATSPALPSSPLLPSSPPALPSSPPSSPPPPHTGPSSPLLPPPQPLPSSPPPPLLPPSPPLLPLLPPLLPSSPPPPALGEALCHVPPLSPANGDQLRPLALPRPVVWSRPRQGYPVRPAIPVNKKPNLVGKPGDKDKLSNLKQTDRLSVLKPNFPAVTSKPKKKEERQTTTTSSSKASRFEHWEESEVFSPQPNSDLDALGKKRFVAPHVVYKTDKKPEEPCSITTSLHYFPGEQPSESDPSAPPKAPPSNLTVVTVEGCPSFIILDWKNTDNHTQEYEVISTATGPDGEEVSVLTTNQTHTAVENLKPESSYEFKVKPKNELGAGPPSEPVAFSTESADPRVSENASGKDAIWTQFPFRTDSFSDCTGRQYVKRTWYRKFVGVQLCNSLRYKIYLSDSLTGTFYNIGDEVGFGEDHCQFVDSFLDGKTGPQLRPQQLPARTGFHRAERQEPVRFGEVGGDSHVGYVSWYECGAPIPGRW